MTVIFYGYNIDLGCDKYRRIPMLCKSGRKTAANEFFLFELFIDVLVVVDCTALHGFFELECYVDFGIF